MSYALKVYITSNQKIALDFMTMYSFWFKYYVERVVAPFNKYPVKYCYQSDRSTKMFMKVLAT